MRKPREQSPWNKHLQHAAGAHGASWASSDRLSPKIRVTLCLMCCKVAGGIQGQGFSRKFWGHIKTWLKVLKYSLISPIKIWGHIKTFQIGVLNVKPLMSFLVWGKRSGAGRQRISPGEPPWHHITPFWSAMIWKEFWRTRWFSLTIFSLKPHDLEFWRWCGWIFSSSYFFSRQSWAPLTRFGKYLCFGLCSFRQLQYCTLLSQRLIYLKHSMGTEVDWQQGIRQHKFKLFLLHSWCVAYTAIRNNSRSIG